MITAYGQPAALSLVLPPTDEGKGAGGYDRSDSSSSTNSGNRSSARSSNSSTRMVVDIQVSPCGLFIAVLSPWGILVYSNGQYRMLLGRCLVPRDSEVYGRLTCCCWASDSSAVFVSADPLACVCIFSIRGSSSNSGGLLQQQLQELQQQKPTWTETGGWRAASSAEGLNEPSTVGAVAGVAPTTGGESWLTEGFSTAVDAWRLGSTGSFSDDDAEGSEAEEDHIQPAAAENASTAEEAIRSLPSMITAHRPPNTSPLSVSFCLLLRLPVRPSALCCSSVQRHQQLLLAGCSRQPALFWLDLGGLKQVLGCLYTSDLLRVAKRAGVCPGNAGPPFAAVAASGVASTAATTPAWSGAAYQSRTTAVPGDWGCPCSACGGRCCCFLERPSLQPMRRCSSRNGGSAPAEATLPSSRRCRCLGRRRLITYLYHPKGYTAVTDLLRLPASAQDAQLLPDLPDVFLCGDSSQDPGWSLPTSLGSGSASTSRRRSRTLRTPQVPRSMGYSSSAECSSKRATRDDVVGAGLFHRSAKSLSVREPQRRSTSQLQLHLDAFRSSDSSSTANAKSSCNNSTTICNSTIDPTVNQAVASRSGRSTTGVRDARRNPVASVASLGGVLGKPDSSLADRATVAVAAAGSNSSSSSGDTSDDGVSLGWRSSRLTRGPRNARPLELPQQMREVRWPVLRSLTDDTFPNYEALRARCCGGVRQLQLNCRLDILAVVTASGELLLLAWRFPLRGYSEVDECEGIQDPGKDSCVAPQPRKGHFASQQHLQRLEPEFPIAAAAEGGRDVSEAPSPAREGSQLSGGRSTSRRRGCGSISIGAGRDGRVAIGHSAREGFVNAYSASETGHRNSNANMLRPWRPLGLQLRAEGVCCCALNGERSLVAVGLGNGSVEVYRLIWPRNPVQRVRSSRDPHRQQTQQRSTRRIHRDVERDGFTLLPQLLHVITVPDDIRVAAAQQESIGAIRTAAGATCTMGAPYLRARSVQSLQWTADGAALSVRWLRGGTAVFSHTGSILFSLPDPFAAEASAQASSAGLPHPISRPSGGSQRPWQQKLLYSGEVWGGIAATAAAVAAGSAAGSGQLCCWIMGGLSLLHACPSLGANAQLQPDGQCTGLGRNVMFYEVDPKIEGPTSEQLLEVPVVRSASVAVAASSVDVCGSRCASDLTDRVMIGGSHLLVWSFLGNVKASAALSLIPLPPNLYTAKAFPVRQAALSPDGSHMLVSGRRGFALFTMLQRRWRLLCMESQEAQLPTGTLPLGWYTKDIFFVSTPACNQPDAAQSAATAAAAPEPRSTLNAPDAAPRWLLPSSVFHRFEAAVAAAVDFCPSRFAAHVPLTIHEKTAWLQQQQQQYQQSAARLWGAAGTGSGTRELSAVAAGAASRGTGSSSTTMWHYAVLFLSSSERLDLRCRVAEIKRLPARPHTATVLPSLQQQQLLRPAASLGSRCCLCHRESNSSCNCCMLCSGRAAFALRSVAAGNTTEPLLAIYDALGILTAYQLQQPQSPQQQQQQPRQQDAVALWQLDLSDFCERPPQQIRFVGCAWLLLVLLQSGTLLLLRLGMPGSGHPAHNRVHRIPRLIVDTFTVVAEGVTGLWVGAEAQLQQHYLLPSSRFCVLRAQQQHQRQQSQELAGKGVRDPYACCCSCLAHLTVSPRQHDGREERQQEELHHDEPASCGLRVLEEVALKQSTVNGSDPDHERRLSDDKLNPCSREGSSNSSRTTESAFAEQYKARSTRPWPVSTTKIQGSSAVIALHETHSGSSRSNLSAESAAVSPSLFVGPRAPSSTAVPLSPLPFQRIVDFPRPAAVVPARSNRRGNINLYEAQLQHQQEQDPLKHLMRERCAPLSLPVLSAEISHQAGGASQRSCEVSGSKPKEAGGLPATGTPEQRVRRRFQTFWAAGRKQFLNDNQKQPKGEISLEAYARGSSSVLLYSTQSKAAGETAGAAKSETTEAAPTASGGFAASTLRAEPSFVDSEGCGGSGLDSSPATRGPAVAAQLWEARIENCDVCCCCVAGWHLWAQTASGLLLASVGFHYSGTAAAAEAADLTPEHLLAVTDVRLRSALVLPVEARPQPLHIVGVLGELGVAVACTPSRETALGFPIQIQPATQIRLLVQPCTHALLQRQLLAAVACIPVNSRAHFGLVKGRAFDAAAEGLMKELTKCTGSAKSIDSNQDNCSTCKRVFMSVSALVRELLASAFAHHLLELSQFGLLMRCISTYLKAAKLRGLQLQPCKNSAPPPSYPATTTGVPSGGSIYRGSLEDLAGSVRSAAAAALGSSSEGVALQWLLHLLQRKSPHVFVATLVFCMRKTEPLVSPAVLGSLLQRQVPPVDPITLFTKCLESGLLQTASLYLLPIQTAEGPLQVRCRRVLPLLRAALEAGNFLLVRKLLHFFWAFFRRRHHPRSACNRSKAQQQQLWAEPASVAPVGCPVQRRREGQHSEGQQNFVYKRRTRRKSHQVSQLRSLLWRPLHAEDLNFQITESTAEAGADDSFSTNPWLSRVPLELPHVDRLLAARVYQEVERTVAAAASALLQQQQWLRLFDLATTLALDLPAWLRGHSKGDLLDQVDQRHKQNTQKQMPGADGLATSTAKTVPEGTEHSCRAATAGAAATASQVLPLFSEAVLSFTQQLCIGDTPLSLRLKRPLILDCSSSSVEEKYKQLYPAWQGELQVAGSAAAVLEMACRQSWTCTASLVPPLCSNWNRQQHAAAEIARYLANVLLRSGLPVYTLALAAAARDRVAAAQIFGWYPRLRCLFLPTVGSAWVDGAEGQAALSRGQAAKEV